MLALSILSVGVDGAWASEASTQEAFTGDKLEEIIVTAQKREQNPAGRRRIRHRVRFASLQRLGLHNVTDIAEQVPGLQFNQYGGPRSRSITCAGCHKMTSDDHQEAPVARVMTTRRRSPPPGALAGSNVRLQRVEVLRGPQGTLFGRNATGGLIHYIRATSQATSRAATSISLAATTAPSIAKVAVNQP